MPNAHRHPPTLSAIIARLLRVPYAAIHRSSPVACPLAGETLLSFGMASEHVQRSSASIWNHKRVRKETGQPGGCRLSMIDDAVSAFVDRPDAPGYASRMVESFLRERRRRLGLTQQTLADRAGLARQTVNALETGAAAPTLEAAFRLAAVLECRVEDLFRLAGGADLQAEQVGPPPEGGRTRVALARIGERWLARPLRGISGGPTARPADGLATARAGRRVAVELLAPEAALAGAIFGIGCDPAMALLAAHLERRGGGAGPRPRLHAFHGSSRAALEGLAAGEAHLAGTHLAEGADVPAFLSGLQVTVLTFAHWEEGLLVAAGNPKRVKNVSDLARPGLRFINREEGSGSRALLDTQLQAYGIVPGQVRGYNRLAAGHLAVAAAVAAGAADVGLGIRAAAAAEGLDFLPLQEARYDLVIPALHLEHPTIRALLEILQSAALRREVAALEGYDPREMGKVVQGAES